MDLPKVWGEEELIKNVLGRNVRQGQWKLTMTNPLKNINHKFDSYVYQQLTLLHGGKSKMFAHSNCQLPEIRTIKFEKAWHIHGTSLLPYLILSMFFFVLFCVYINAKVNNSRI